MSTAPRPDRDAAKTDSAPAEPVLCAKGCGFYGNPKFQNMCSVCWKKDPASKKAAEEDETAQKVGQRAPERGSVAAAAAPADAKGESGGEPAPRPKQENTSRCWSCNRKVGLTGIKCRCGYVFCERHRYSDQHDCEFDFKAFDRSRIAQANPVIKSNKGLDRIDSDM